MAIAATERSTERANVDMMPPLELYLSLILRENWETSDTLLRYGSMIDQTIGDKFNLKAPARFVDRSGWRCRPPWVYGPHFTEFMPPTEFFIVGFLNVVRRTQFRPDLSNGGLASVFVIASG